MKFYSLLLLILFIPLNSFAQNKEDLSAWTFEELEKKYDSLDMDVQSAMRYIQAAAKKTKAEKDFSNLMQVYRVAASYSKAEIKSAYTDSMVWAAEKTGKNDKIGLAWLSKGINHYN